MRRIAILALFLTACGSARAHEPCKPALVAAFDTETSPEGMVLVQGAVEGHRGAFLLDTGGMGAWLGVSTAATLKHMPEKAPVGGELIGGTLLDHGITADDFAMGPLRLGRQWFLVAPDTMLAGDGVGGLQPHMLGAYNVEIDFLKGKFNLFRPGSCAGHAVYWTGDAHAGVPMRVDPLGHITVKAMLDGKAVDALIDTGSQNSAASLDMARRVFGLDAQAPGMQDLGMTAINGTVPARKYRYPFKALTFGGIAVANPDIEIDDTGNDAADSPLILGIGALRQLHMFIAYDEGLLYLTPAEAH